jgi:hypothetical protein
MNWPKEIDIIRAVAPSRIQLAESRRQALSIARIAGQNIPMIEKELPAIFPPRRQWEKFRPRKHGGSSEEQLRAESLIRCMSTGLHENRGEKWTYELRLFIDDLQSRITGSENLELESLSAVTSKCTTCGHFKVHHFGRSFFSGWCVLFSR